MEKNWKKPVIKHSNLTKYNYLVHYPENLELGNFFDIGAFTFINAHYGVKILDNVQIGSHCSIYSNSTIDSKKGRIVLEKNCKIGTHSTVMPNVSIGENSIVGAYSFVTKDIPPNEVWFGVPAKFIKKL